MKSVYLFKKHGNNPIKIGISEEPTTRAKTLNANNRNGYSLFHSYPVFIPTKIEKRIHNILYKYSIGGEFFLYPFKKARWIILNMISNYENIPKKRIKEKRLARELRLLGYEYKDIAKSLGVSKQSISNWVNGVNKIGPVMIRKLSEHGISSKALSNPSELI